MRRPPTRLFHLHYNTPDVNRFETALADVGLPLHRRFGWVDTEFRTLSPDDPVPDNWRLYVETLQNGYANVTLGSGERFRFDHLGIYSSEFDAIIERADAAGWRVHDPDGRRPFLMTPWRFRIEIHPDGDAVEAELGEWTRARFAEIELVVPREAPVRAELLDVIGAVPGLVINSGDVDRATVRRFTLAGDQFAEPTVVTVDELRGRSKSGTLSEP